MRRPIVIAATALAAAALAGTAAAEPLGAHVAMCAHQLGGRAEAPTATCAHDGMSMTFPTFGAMVQHMCEMHAATP